MKACRVCGRLYPDDAGFCPIDGQALHSASQVAVAVDERDARIGQVLCDRYQIRRVVADGGMGRVYEALDLAAGRNVAVKVLHPEVSQDTIAVERFKREFEVSALLPNPHVVNVIDFQPTPDGSYALVMEFLYGEELRATLKRESVVSQGRLVRLLSQVALALDEAHAKHLVHRDLKPDNIFLCQTPEGDIAKILDFGSVKDKADGAKKLTILGTTIGSPYYMAPEQAQGLDTLDQRADVWALAAIAYECVTGQVPFKGVNGPSILLEILTKEPVAPSVAGKDAKLAVPPTLDKVFTRAFKKTPAVRTSSVGAFADDVGHAYGLGGVHAAWAVTRERELQEAIELRLPELMNLAPEEKKTGDAADSFFGAGNSLGPMDTAFARAEVGAATQLAPSSGTLGAAPPPSSYHVPTRSLPKWLIPAGVVLALGMIALLLILFVFTGCSRESDAHQQAAAQVASAQSSAVLVTSAASSAPPSAAPAAEDCTQVQSPSSVDEENYKLTLTPKDTYTAGKPGEAVLELDPKNGYHTNDQYPYKLKLMQCSGMTFPNLTIHDDAIKLEKTKGTMAVAFTPQSSGQKIIAGTFSFSVCSDERCMVEKRDLSLKISVQ